MEHPNLDVTVTQAYIDALDRLVEKGIYLDRGEIIMDALMHLFRRYKMAPFYRALVHASSPVE